MKNRLAVLALIAVWMAIPVGCASDPPELKQTHDLEPVAYEASLAKRGELYFAALADLRAEKRGRAFERLDHEIERRKDEDGKVAAEDVQRLLMGAVQDVFDEELGRVVKKRVGGLFSGLDRIDDKINEKAGQWESYDPNKAVFYDLHGTVSEWLGRTGISREQQDVILSEAIRAARRLQGVPEEED